jgi:hypothetical protein
MAGKTRQQLTEELLRLTDQQRKTLEDAVYLGWLPEILAAYQERGERVSELRHQLSIANAEEMLETLPGTLPTAPDFDDDPS